MNRRTSLVQTDAVALVRFDHPPGEVHHDPERECAGGHRVSFVESGAFRAKTTGAWEEFSREWLFVQWPGLEFSCAHDEDRPSDSCLSVAFSDEAVESARSTAALDEVMRVPLTNRLAFLQRALRTCAPGDDARTEALGGALLFSLAAKQSRQPLFRADRLSWYAARVERARALMESRYAEPLSLSTLARDAGMSVFHFARIFGELEGRPPHRVLTDIRLARAQARLRDGDSVTDTCFAVGFGSLSHFVTTFRQHYGIRPSELRRGTPSTTAAGISSGT